VTATVIGSDVEIPVTYNIIERQAEIILKARVINFVKQK